MKISVLCIGKADKKLYMPLQEEYRSRIVRFLPCEVTELNEAPPVRQLSKGEINRCIEFEGKEIIDRLEPGDFVVALCINGKELGSEEIAGNMSELMQSGKKRCVFVIGGSHGLSDEVVRRADFKLSFGKITMPHQLARIVLLEQLYRAFTIINNITYHK